MSEVILGLSSVTGLEKFCALNSDEVFINRSRWSLANGLFRIGNAFLRLDRN